MMIDGKLTYQQKETKRFWDLIASKTNSLVNISFATYEEGNKNCTQLTQLNNGIPISPEKVFWLLQAESSWHKNKKYKKSVLWKFYEDQIYNIVIVDNIQYLGLDLMIRLDAFLLWRIGESKYQAAFLLDRYVDVETAKKIQHFFATIYKVNKENIWGSYSFKIPGFYNVDYINDSSYMEYIELVFQDETNVLDVEHIMFHYKHDIIPKERKERKKTVKQS